MSALADRRHVVYELWMNDVCLYVGMTSDLKARLAAHRRRNHMVQSATRIKATPCENRAVAERLERSTIRDLRPANNLRGAAA